MRTRDHIQELTFNMGTSGTHTFNLDYTDPITAISMNFEAVNGATDNKEQPIERCISKIEIVDGGTVLWDLPGDVALAVAAHLRNHLPHCYRTEVGGDTPYQTIPLNFGRYLYDPTFAFNPKAHRNPQLKVTFNEVLNQAAGNDGYVSDSWELDLVVRLMEDVSAPSGFFAARDIYEYTSLDAGDTRIELPTDRLLRNLIVRPYLTEIDLRSVISNYKFSLDGGKFIPFDVESNVFVTLMCNRFKPIVVPSIVKVTNATRVETWIGIDLIGQLTPRGDDIIVGADTFWPGAVYPYVFGHDGTDGTDKDAFMSVVGWCMHNTLIYPFGRLGESADWFDPRPYRQLDLVLTNADADGEVNVCVEQLYTY